MTDAYQLNLRHLRMLTSVADAGSISAAARGAGVTQPALSQALQKLEAAFGTKLFERSGKGIFLTGDGRRVVRRTKRAMNSLTHAMRGVDSLHMHKDPLRFLSSAHLRGLLTLAEQGSYVAAARATGVSSPALHRAVRDLEAGTGVELVERKGRGLGLTHAGQILARGFTIGIAEVRAALEECSKQEGRLAIGAMALSRSLLLPATLARLISAQPDVQADVVEGSYLELAELLRDGRIDILIGALRKRPGHELRQEALFTDRLTIIGRAGHPLASKVADFEDLAAYPWIVARRASGLLERWQQMFDHASVPRPKAPIQCGSVALIRGVLVRSNLLTLLSRNQVNTDIVAGSLIQIRSDIPDTMRTIGAITRRDWYPTALQELFMTLLREVAQETYSGTAHPS
jgi:LysR family transcriptional regulator, regulator for genes of the gallate degradation pathway